MFLPQGASKYQANGMEHAFKIITYFNIFSPGIPIAASHILFYSWNFL